METITVNQNFTVEYTDIREGITVDFGNGKEIEIPPHSQRVHLEVWANGIMEVLFYDEPQPGQSESDRIHLMVTGFDFGAVGRKGFLMNVQDAIALIRGLSAGIQRAIEAGVPTKPEGAP